ncbi:MAG: response regulator [Candidatus Marinimicrobia bacterium]|nr:response regulator [Candidatus Neomarinimicrobiota bacterium]
MEKLARILLAEDSKNEIELTLNALEEINLANEVFVVHDGDEALNYLYYCGEYAERPNGNPAVILLDLKMPKVDGLEVLREIKQDENLKTITVVVLTSSRMESDLMKSYELDVNAYIVKPVNFQEFVKSVKELGAFWAILNEAPSGSVSKMIK